MPVIQFKSAKHSASDGEIVELWRDGEFVGAIYPHGEIAIRVISKYLAPQSLAVEPQHPAAVVITFNKSGE